MNGEGAGHIVRSTGEGLHRRKQRGCSHARYSEPSSHRRFGRAPALFRYGEPAGHARLDDRARLSRIQGGYPSIRSTPVRRSWAVLRRRFGQPTDRIPKTCRLEFLRAALRRLGDWTGRTVGLAGTGRRIGIVGLPFWLACRVCDKRPG